MAVYALAPMNSGVKGVRPIDGPTDGLESVAQGWIRPLDFDLMWTPLTALAANADSCSPLIETVADRRGLKPGSVSC